MQDSRDQPRLGDDVFLPDFCAIRVLFIVVLIGELLAIVLTMATAGGFAELGMLSVFIQWIVITDTLLLCLLRKWLRRYDNRQVAIMSFVVLQLVTLLYAGLVTWIFGHLFDTGAIEFVLRCAGMSAIVSLVTLRYFYVQHLWQAQLRAESDARIDALQARIRPHFLFNSMNVIAALTRSDPARAEKAIEDLAELFRFALGDPRRKISLEDELTISRRYLEIEKIRLGDRLQVSWEIDSLPGGAHVPALVIQPIVENAIYHGIEQLTHGGTITVVGKRHNDALELCIANPVPEKQTAGHSTGNHMALENIRARMTAMYSGRSKVTSVEIDDKYSVTLYWPYEFASEDSPS